MGDVKVGIHQPNFLPWLGYFAKIVASDVFILLDDAQYTKNGFVNRNKIRSKTGELWLTVPVSVSLGTPIREARIANRPDWRKTQLRTLSQNFGRAVGFDRVYPAVEEIYAKGHEYLADLNIDLLRFALKELGIDRKVILSSSFGVEETSSERLVELVKAVGGTSYISGKGGSSYQDEELFRKFGLGLEYIRFDPDEYRQAWPGFLPNLSVLDYLMNAENPHTWKPRFRLAPDRSVFSEEPTAVRSSP